MTMNVFKEQLVFFFREGTSFKPFELSMALYQNLSEIFRNSQPTIIPTPNEAPPDVPRCVWNDNNTKLSFNLFSLSLAIDIPTTHNWENLAVEFSNLLSTVFSECKIPIDRIGMIIESSTDKELYSIVKDNTQIPAFTCENEANVSWLAHIGTFNIWTYLIMDVPHEIYKVVYDVNNLVEFKLSEQSIDPQKAIRNAIEIVKGRMNSGI